MQDYTVFIILTLLIGFVAPGEGTGTPPSDLLKCIPTGDRKPNVNVTQSPHDKRQYKYITLENKLRMVLVNDPDAEKSAAAVSVHVGYSSDPPSVPGLAHFLEHMLFLGTEKYPDEAEFTNFLSQHGGRTNAYTASEETVYFFKINSESLEPALDRFAQFFISPLFDANSTNRELHAVDQEAQKNYRNDEWIIDYIQRAQSHRGHPYGKFGTGNLKTLKTTLEEKNIDIRQELLKFYHRYYSSNIMAVAVIGRESLADLEKMTVPMFKNVENRNKTVRSHNFPYSKKAIATMLRIPTVQKMNQLEIRFQYPDFRCFYKSKPIKYFTQILGHEAKGSLAFHLKKLGLVHTLEAWDESGLIGFEMFILRMDLTKKGLERVDDIITYLFQYLKMMQSSPPQKWIHEELRALDRTEFMFKDKQKPYWYAVTLVNNLQQYEAEDVINGDFISGEFMKDMVQELFGFFTPDNIRYSVASDKFKGPWNRHADYYDVEYSQHKIPKGKLMKWKNVKTNAAFHLPLKNPFIPEPDDLNIVVPRNNNPIKNVPVIIKDNEMVRVWYKADDTFFLPKAAIEIGLHSPNALDTPSKHNHLLLFATLVEVAMMEFGYAATLVGIEYSIEDSETGLQISIYGVSSKQDILVHAILHHIVAMKQKVDPEKFKVAKQRVLEELKNTNKQVPYEQIKDLRNYVTSEKSWSTEEKLLYIDELTVDSLKRYIDRFLRNIYIEAGFAGNILRDKALSTFNVVEEVLLKENGARPMLSLQHLRPKEYNLEEGKNYAFEKRSPVHKFSALGIYYQVGLRTERNNVICELLNQMIRALMFDMLRTKEQLGYVVFSGVSRSQSVLGFAVLVQSEREPSYVDQRVDNFFQWFKNDLRNMPETKFKEYVEATAVTKLEKPKKLEDELEDYMLEISRRQYHFRRAENEVEVLRKLKKDDVMSFFEQYIDPASNRRKKLAVVVLGKNTTSLGEDINTNWSVIDDILQFKTSLPLYQHVLPYNNIPLLSTRKTKKKNEL